MSINLEDNLNSPIDAVKFHKLQRLLAADFAAALDSFVKQAQIYCTAIRTAIMDDRLPDATNIAHKLKSSSGLYGFWKVSKLSNDIEYTRLTIGTDRLLKLQSDLEAALSEAINTLGERP